MDSEGIATVVRRKLDLANYHIITFIASGVDPQTAKTVTSAKKRSAPINLCFYLWDQERDAPGRE